MNTTAHIQIGTPSLIKTDAQTTFYKEFDHLWTTRDSDFMKAKTL